MVVAVQIGRGFRDVQRWIAARAGTFRVRSRRAPRIFHKRKRFRHRTTIDGQNSTGDKAGGGAGEEDHGGGDFVGGAVAAHGGTGGEALAGDIGSGEAF